MSLERNETVLSDSQTIAFDVQEETIQKEEADAASVLVVPSYHSYCRACELFTLLAPAALANGFSCVFFGQCPKNTHEKPKKARVAGQGSERNDTSQALTHTVEDLTTRNLSIYTD